MFLKLFLPSLLCVLTSVLRIDACQSCYLYQNELIYITNEEFEELQNNYQACSEGWLSWQCCKCQYYNGHAFSTCQNCKKAKCQRR